DIDRPAIKRLERRDRSQYSCFASARESHQRDELAAIGLETNAAQHVPIAARQSQVADAKERAHADGMLHRRSSARATRDSGSESARYSAAQIAPGTTQLPMFAAKIDVCFVNSTTVITETSDESFSSATKSFVIGASARRNAC